MIELSERTTQMNETQVEQYVLELATDLLNEHGLIEKNWTIKFLDENRENAGQVFHRPKLITFTREFIFDTRVENLLELVRHEVAHALCPNGDHNQKWYDTLMRLGGSGRWYLTSDFWREVKISDN